MELEFETRPLSFLRQCVRGICRQEQTQDVIVSDTSPDATEVVYCCAQAVVRSKTCRDGSIELTGGVQASALYLTEQDSEPRKLEAYLPFMLRLDNPEITEQTQVIFDCRVCSAEARLVNSRKMLFRAEVAAQLCGYLPQECRIALLTETPQQLQLHCRSYPLLCRTETAEKSFLVSDDSQISGSAAAESGNAAAVQLVSATVMPVITEQRIVGSKAVFKGTLAVRILYIGSDGALYTAAPQLPFSQYCQLAGDYDDDPLTVGLTVTGCDVQLQSDSAGITALISVDLLAQCIVSQQTTLPFCDDAFATSGTLNPEWSDYCFDCRLDRQALRLPLRESLRCEGIQRVLDTAILPGFARAERCETGVKVSVPVGIRVLGYDGNGKLVGASGSAQVETTVCAADSTELQVSVLPIQDLYVSAGDGAAEVRCEIYLDTETNARECLRSLSGGTLDPADLSAVQRPSVIVKAVPAAVSVWEVAKQYSTSICALCDANQISGEEIEAGTMLLIPIES